MTTWNELLEEFRALGGTAENIRLGQGEFGRGLFPIEQGKPVAIHIPDNLLVPVSDWVSDGGAPRVGPKAKTGERVGHIGRAEAIACQVVALIDRTSSP